MKSFYTLVLILCCYYATAQSPGRYWSVGLNPFGLIEPMPLIGPAVSYRVSPKIELWSEVSYIFSNLYVFPDWKQVKGYRFILQPRFYPAKDRSFFVAAEFRLKHFTYKTYDDFINVANSDTLYNFHYKGSQVLSGGAVIIGTTIPLDKKNHLFMEITFGLGSKVRRVKAEDIPAGFERLYYQRKEIFNVDYDINNAHLVYAPTCIRLMWKLR